MKNLNAFYFVFTLLFSLGVAAQGKVVPMKEFKSKQKGSYLIMDPQWTCICDEKAAQALKSSLVFVREGSDPNKATNISVSLLKNGKLDKLMQAELEKIKSSTAQAQELKITHPSFPSLAKTVTLKDQSTESIILLETKAEVVRISMKTNKRMGDQAEFTALGQLTGSLRLSEPHADKKK